MSQPAQVPSCLYIRYNKINEDIIRIHYKLIVVLLVLYNRMPEVVVLKFLNKELVDSH